MARTHELDNLRTFLTVLVIFHHVSIPYGGLGSWPYKPSPPFTPSIFIALFNVVNQTFFMALFFLLSGYFSAIAAEKRTRKAFLKDKWKRIGVPCALYSIFGPGIVAVIIALLRDGAPFQSSLERAATAVCSVRGARGPLWYSALLVVFDTIYALTFFPAPQARKENAASRPPHKSYLPDSTILLGLAGATVASFLLRLRWPIGTTFAPLGLEMGFLPQYVVYYAAGVYARQSLGSELHRLVPRSSVRIPGTFVALRFAALALLLAVSVGVLHVFTLWLRGPRSTAEIWAAARGGWNRLAVCYAVLNESLGFVVSVVLLRSFNQRQGLKTRWVVRGVDLARWSYAAFLVHTPVVVAVQCALRGWNASGVVKTAVAGSLGCVGSWVVGWALGRGLERAGVKGYI